jgi:hypothetical protein
MADLGDTCWSNSAGNNWPHRRAVASIAATIGLANPTAMWVKMALDSPLSSCAGQALEQETPPAMMRVLPAMSRHLDPELQTVCLA